jgi:hypothetical protein
MPGCRLARLYWQAIVSLRVVDLEPPLALRQKDSQGRVYFLSIEYTTPIVLYQVKDELRANRRSLTEGQSGNHPLLAS